MIEARKQEIVHLVDEIKGSYDTSQFEELKRATTDRGVGVIVSSQIIIPSTWYIPEIEKAVVFTRRTKFRNLNLRYMGHEMGHALLDHQNPDSSLCEMPYTDKELEAEMFADLLVGPLLREELEADAIRLLLARPYKTLRTTHDRQYHSAELERLVRFALSRT